MSTQLSDTETPEPGGSNVVVIKQKRGWGGIFLVIIGLTGLLCAGYVGLALLKLVPDISNPFSREVTNNTGPALLESITDASEFLAARGTFQVVVDYEEGRRYIPSWVVGCKAIYVGYGEVDATVDVSGLTEDDIQVSADGTEITVTVPEPTLSDVDTDVTQSYRIAEERGIVERVTGMFSGSGSCVTEAELVQLAEEKIATAASESDLLDRARQNTRVWLEGMLLALGFERVTINFVPNPV